MFKEPVQNDKAKKAATQPRPRDTRDVDKPKNLERFGRRYLIMKTRKRVTADGGASVLVLGEEDTQQ